MFILERFRTITFIALSIFGCAGNLLTLIIINQRFFRKTASAAFIFGLCLADCVVLCLHTLQIVAKDHPHVTIYECGIIFLTDVFRLFSIWIVCFINIERCSLVFNPCHMPRLTSRIKSRIFVFILFLLALIIFSHYGRNMYTAHTVHNQSTNSTLFYCTFREDFPNLLWICIKSALTYWITVPLCTICNIIIIKQLHRASRIERTLYTNYFDLSTKQRQLTAMLVASSIGFVLTASPTAIHTIYLTLKQDKPDIQYVIHIFTSILLHFHHASNFLVFLFSCGRFRLEVVRFFRHSSLCTISFACYRSRSNSSKPMAIYSTNPSRTAVKLFVVTRHSRRRRSRTTTNRNSQRKTRKNYGPCLVNYYK